MKSRWLKILAVAALWLAAGAPAGAQSGLTREQGEAILNELRQIRLLLERQQKPEAARPAQTPAARVKVSVTPGRDWCLGREDAPLTLVEFSDYQCSFCKRFYATTFGELKRDYIDTGRLRYVSRDLPLANHPQARLAAKAARCAGVQGRYWEMRELLMKSSDLSQKAIQEAAGSLSLDTAGLKGCLQQDLEDAEVQRDLTEAASVGITGTPTFVLGRTAKGSVEGVKIVGSQPYATFKAAIEELLSQSRDR